MPVDFLTSVASQLTDTFTSFRWYRGNANDSIPAGIIEKTRLLYLLQMDFDGGAPVLPVVPENNRLNFIYVYLRLNAETSWGVAAPELDDVGTSWRNATSLYRIVFERSELTSVHQVSLVQSIEREILAGLGSTYTSTSTTVRQVDFRSTASGENEALDQAALVALGWTIEDPNRMTKVSDGRTWNVNHN